MGNIFIGILLCAFVLAIIKIFSFKKDIKNINDSLNIIKNNNTNKRITSVSMDKQIIGLINEINSILDENRIYYEKNNKNIKEMIINISHDLRTPLTKKIYGHWQIKKL